MRLFHATAHAGAILRDGFRDGTSAYGGRRGVWLADRVMTSADFSSLGNDVLAVDVPHEVVAPFEQADDELGLPDGMPYYRAFLVPAEIVNRYPRRSLAPR